MKRKLIIFLIVLFIVAVPYLIPLFDQSTVYIDKLYMDVTINTDGSISVKKIDSYKGDYNGIYASYGYKNAYAPIFTGENSDLEGSSIYNGSAITNLKVGEVSQEDLTFDDLFHAGDFYSETVYGSNGEHGVYEFEDTGEAVQLKVFNPSSRKKAIYYEYTIEDMIVKHNDVEELAWTVFNGENLERTIKNLEIRIHLPKEDSTMLAWGHGVLQGELTRDSDSQITLTAENVGKGNDLGVRILFDKDLVASTKNTNMEAKETILKIEQRLADEANEQRRIARTRSNIIWGISIAWLVIMILYLIYTYIKYDKEYEYSLPSPYLRELPATYAPSTLEYLLKKDITPTSFSTEILELIRKKAITIEEPQKKNNKKKEYIFKNTSENMELSSGEQKVISLLFKTIGDKNEVTMQDINDYAQDSSTAPKFMLNYNKWKAEAKKEAVAEGFYEKVGKTRIIGVVFSVLAFAIAYSNYLYNIGVVLCTVNCIVAVVAIIYLLVFKKKTKKGIEHYTKWMAFKRFLKDFGRFKEKELPEIKLWEQYLVYAHILGIAKEVEKEMKIKMEEYYGDQIHNPTYIDMFYMYHIMNLNLNHTITSSITKAVSASQSTIAASHASSVGGGGGGFSGGGGSFGGGGGQGSF